MKIDEKGKLFCFHHAFVPNLNICYKQRNPIVSFLTMQRNHWATIAKSGETKRVLDADSEEMKDESKFEVFTKLQRILLQKMHKSA